MTSLVYKAIGVAQIVLFIKMVEYLSPLLLPTVRGLIDKWSMDNI